LLHVEVPYEAQNNACYRLLALRSANSAGLCPFMLSRVVLKMRYISCAGRRLLCSVLVTIMLAFQVLSVGAAPASYTQAVADFQSKRYAQALSGFQTASRANPSDPMCHYYMALCYQYLNQVGYSTQEYQWVAANSRDPRLKAQAQSGLAGLQRYQSARMVQLSSATAAALPAASGGPNTPPPNPFTRGRIKVIEFNTKWCGVCKKYDPVFDQVRSDSKFSSRCEFNCLDAEEPGNADLVQKYAINSYPTTVFADASGKMINRFRGFASAEGLGSMINLALSKVPK
jgi:thiol-disulfide isomerase/thioredoxin